MAALQHQKGAATSLDPPAGVGHLTGIGQLEHLQQFELFGAQLQPQQFEAAAGQADQFGVGAGLDL